MDKQIRRSAFVDRQVQGALLRRVLIHWCTFLLVSIMSITTLQFLLGDPNLSFREHLNEAWSQYAMFTVILVALLPAFLLDTVKLSNRFAGPVMRLRRALRQLADGEPVDQLKFRDSDFWQEIAADFNRVTSHLSDDANGAKQAPTTESERVAS